MTLIEKTNRLLSVCEECQARHKTMRELDREPNFFEEVKPFADEQFAAIDQWVLLILEWIQKKRPKYVHATQIYHTEEAMKQFIVQSFYQKTGKKRFIQSIQSVQYTLKTIVQALKEEQHDSTINDSTSSGADEG